MIKEEGQMVREELKAQIDELMRQYADEEIDGVTYQQKMMELTTLAQKEKKEDRKSTRLNSSHHSISNAVF